MKLLIMGPPGVGKGTQAKILSKKLNITHLSTGEILRGEIQKNTKIGEVAKSYIDHGNLVPDDLILNIISEKISVQIQNKGYLLDGFPRTIPQATGFDKLLNKINHNLDFAINLTANEDELIKRILERGKFSGRSDESVDIVKKRQKIYWAQTAPLIKYYQYKNILKNINGIGEVEEITKSILEVIN
ncbi:MAG: adenylate kinase [Candidatus Marinimicrobia bacterium]|nr:adenylate kinase [Candidatus Neomarinimicrobiota bacterium]